MTKHAMESYRLSSGGRYDTFLLHCSPCVQCGSKQILVRWGDETAVDITSNDDACLNTEEKTSVENSKHRSDNGMDATPPMS
jgi:hypothetical protein